MLLLLPSLLTVWLRSSWEPPATWSQIFQTTGETIQHPLSLDIPVSTAGTWLGFVAGVQWLQVRDSFHPKGGVWRRGKQYLMGMSVAIALWAGLDLLFPDGRTLVAYSLRYLRYAILGGWIAAGAPLLFQQLVRFH